MPFPTPTKRPEIANISPAHDKMLFIVQHQTSERRMKLMRHELRAPAGLAGAGSGCAVRRGAAPAGPARPAGARQPTGRDWTQGYAESDAVESAWLTVYRDPKQYGNLYQFDEGLTGLEDAFRLWRFRHVTTAERVIGFKRGTGGVSYLRKMLDMVRLPEIWKLRTRL